VLSPISIMSVPELARVFGVTLSDLLQEDVTTVIADIPIIATATTYIHELLTFFAFMTFVF